MARSRFARLSVPVTVVAAFATAAGAAAAPRPTPTAGRVPAGLSPKVLARALEAAECARARGVADRPDLLTIIDYSLPSTEKRLWVLDLQTGKVLFHELVAHGRGSGDNRATRFSNTDGSLQTSLGLFVTGGTYQGGNGYSMKLHGLERGVNDHALQRTIVVHGAWYVSAQHARQNGRLGRSWGCPALSQAVAKPVIDTIKNGTLLFAYYPEDEWLQSSTYLGQCPVRPTGGTTVLASAGR